MNGTLPYILAALVVCGLDVMTRWEITLWVLYLVPIGIASWNLGRPGGYRVGAGCVALHVLSWIHAPAPIPVLAALLILGSRFAVFALVIALVGALRSKEVERVFHPTVIN